MAFWGLVLEPKKTYTQREVEQPFHISMAALDLASCDGSEDISIVCRKQDADFVLCNLSKKRGIYNVPLNLDFELGGEISFHVVGNSTVHLTGFMIEDESFEESDDSFGEEEEEEDETMAKALLKPATKKLLESSGKRKPQDSPDKKAKKIKMENQDDDDDDDEDDSDFDMEESSADEVEEEEDEGDEDLEDEEEDDDDDDDEEDEDDDDDANAQDVIQKIAALNRKSPQQKQLTKPNNQAAKTSPKETTKPEQNAKQGKKDKKEQAKNQTPNKNQTVNNKSNGTQPQVNGVGKKILHGGVQCEDLVVGNGPAAKSGSLVSVYYVGRLKSNNKQFDAAQSGQGFKFRLGRNEVVKGWDVGIQGMKVGGKRRLTIPPKMGYGDQGAGKVIPPNATLVFDVELKHVK